MALEDKYQYNQKELNSDFGLLWSDYGARWLDLQRGVWGQIDPLAEKYYAWSGYNYVAGNPIRNGRPRW
jgi:RHS repeat-associated protein